MPAFLRRLVLLPIGLVMLFAIAAVPVAAVEPIDRQDPALGAWPESESRPGPGTRPLPPRDPSRPPRPTATAGPTAVPTPVVTATTSPSAEPVADAGPLIGYDISYPQCGDPYPEAPGFAIVGVNGGRVHSANPCLVRDGADAGQLAWAGPDADLYLNTGNPGPRISRYWPARTDDPRPCRASTEAEADTADCAFVYGWIAAEAAYATALEAFRSLDWIDDDAERLPGERTIWLDVEPANSWRGDRELNVAALEGMVAYLESVEVDEVGFYSTPRLWQRITGGTDRFADHPAWHAGARDADDALARCADPSFTGGELRMVQWVEDGFDHNVRCP